MKLDAALFGKGEHVVCAVSGGADSMALLHALFSQRKSLSIRVSAAHFNHRLRGEESDRDERFVRDFCARWGIELNVGSGDVLLYAKEHALSVEEAARELRYAFLHSLGGDKIAVAHNAQDNAETVLQHMLRGSGLRGLCGIAPVREKIIRPLLKVTRQEIERYLQENGVNWVNDSSNNHMNYQRNRIRHEILPQLLGENPNFLHTMAVQSEILRAEDALLDDYAQTLLQNAKQSDGYLCETLLSAPDALQKRALRLLIRQKLPQDITLHHIEAMQQLLRSPSPSARLPLPMGLCMQRCYGSFTLSEPKSSLNFEPVLLDLSEKEVFLPSGWKISRQITKNLQLFKNSPFHFALKYDMITQHGLLLRPRAEGDVLALSCRKSVKKWMIEKKIPVHERQGLAVFVCGDQIAAVAGLGADQAFVANAGEEAVIFSVEKLPSDGELYKKGATP